MLTAINGVQSQNVNFQKWANHPRTMRAKRALDEIITSGEINPKEHPKFFKNYDMINKIQGTYFGLAIPNTWPKSFYSHIDYGYLWANKYPRSEKYYDQNDKRFENMVGQGYNFDHTLENDDYCLGKLLFHLVSNHSPKFLYLGGISERQSMDYIKKLMLKEFGVEQSGLSEEELTEMFGTKKELFQFLKNPDVE